MTVSVDPTLFRYVDLLHESRHIEQARRTALAGQGLSTRTVAWLERGAYEYDLRLGSRFGFSDEYMNWLNKRVSDYWTPSLRTKLRLSERTRKKFEGIWR